MSLPLLPALRELPTRPILRNIILLVVILVLSYSGVAQFSGGGSGGQWSGYYLFFPYCVSATDMNQCLSYDVDGSAYAEKGGMCMNDNYMTGPTPSLYMYSFGSCLPSASVWNEAQVTGEFRDPGFDGYATNTILLTGQVVDRHNGAFHCDGWQSVWQVSSSPCP